MSIFRNFKKEELNFKKKELFKLFQTFRDDQLENNGVSNFKTVYHLTSFEGLGIQNVNKIINLVKDFVILALQNCKTNIGNVCLSDDQTNWQSELPPEFKVYINKEIEKYTKLYSKNFTEWITMERIYLDSQFAMAKDIGKRIAAFEKNIEKLLFKVFQLFTLEDISDLFKCGPLTALEIHNDIRKNSSFDFLSKQKKKIAVSFLKQVVIVSENCPDYFVEWRLNYPKPISKELDHEQQSKLCSYSQEFLSCLENIVLRMFPTSKEPISYKLCWYTFQENFQNLILMQAKLEFKRMILKQIKELFCEDDNNQGEDSDVDEDDNHELYEILNDNSVIKNKEEFPKTIVDLEAKLGEIEHSKFVDPLGILEWYEYSLDLKNELFSIVYSKTNKETIECLTDLKDEEIWAGISKEQRKLILEINRIQKEKQNMKIDITKHTKNDHSIHKINTVLNNTTIDSFEVSNFKSLSLDVKKALIEMKTKIESKKMELKLERERNRLQIAKLIANNKELQMKYERERESNQENIRYEEKQKLARIRDYQLAKTRIQNAHTLEMAKVQVMKEIKMDKIKNKREISLEKIKSNERIEMAHTQAMIQLSFYQVTCQYWERIKNYFYVG